jgi:hypothetical protein
MVAWHGIVAEEVAEMARTELKGNSDPLTFNPERTAGLSGREDMSRKHEMASYMPPTL